MTAFDPSMLPPQPDIIPEDLRALSADSAAAGWQQRIPAAGVGMFIAFVVQTLSDPRFGVSVDLDASPDGWVIRVDLPKPQLRDDVVLPS